MIRCSFSPEIITTSAPEMLEKIEKMVIDKIESQSKPDSSLIKN